MKTFDLLLSSINDVKDFVNIVSKYDFDVDLTSGRYVVDAKSIMGIFSLDLSKPIKVEVHSDDCDKFMEELDKCSLKIKRPLRKRAFFFCRQILRGTFLMRSSFSFIPVHLIVTEFQGLCDRFLRRAIRQVPYWRHVPYQFHRPK